MAICRICGRDAFKEDVLLARVNPLGEQGIFECRPACGVPLPFENRLAIALEESGDRDAGR